MIMLAMLSDDVSGTALQVPRMSMLEMLSDDVSGTALQVPR